MYISPHIIGHLMKIFLQVNLQSLVMLSHRKSWIY